MLAFANEGLMIPEQVWDQPAAPRPGLRFGEGVGSATPLAWTMAQFIRLAANVQAGRNLETPDIVAARYLKQAQAMPLNAGVDDSAFPNRDVLQHLVADATLNYYGRAAAGTRLYALVGSEARELARDEQGRVRLDLRVPAGESVIVMAAVTPDGATGVTRLALRGLTKDELRAYEAQTALLPVFAERFKQTERAPLVNEDEATFIYRGQAKRVEVVGDFTSWRPRDLVMRDLPGTNVKYLTRKFERDARVEYKLIADDKWIDDPLNPQQIDNGVGGFNNYLTMPGYKPAALASDRDDLKGRLEQTEAPTRLLDAAGANYKSTCRRITTRRARVTPCFICKTVRIM